jgi:hypothetical protein
MRCMWLKKPQKNCDVSLVKWLGNKILDSLYSNGFARRKALSDRQLHDRRGVLKPVREKNVTPVLKTNREPGRCAVRVRCSSVNRICFAVISSVELEPDPGLHTRVGNLYRMPFSMYGSRPIN